MRYSILFAVLICYLEFTSCQPPPGPDTTGAQPPQPDQTTSRPQPPGPDTTGAQPPQPDQTTSRPQPPDPDQTTSRPQPSDQTTSRPQPPDPDQTGTGCTVDTADLVAGVLSCPCSAENTANCDALQAQHGADLRNMWVEGEVIVCDKDEGHCSITCSEGGQQGPSCGTVEGFVPGTTLQCVDDGTNQVCTGGSAQHPDQTTSRPQLPDQTGTGGACSTMNIAACTCVYPSDMANCDILQNAFDPFGYTVGCYEGQCTIECFNDADCGILAAGGLDTACDAIYYFCIPCDTISGNSWRPEACFPATETTSRPQQTYGPVFGASCNSIKINYMFGAYPEHVCAAEISGAGAELFSVNYVCDEEGRMIKNEYDNIDCSGTPTRSGEPCEGLGACRYAMSCGGDTCSYSVVEAWYDVTECDGDTVAAFGRYNRVPLVIDDCINEEGSSSKIVCSESGMSLLEYDGADCAGDPLPSLITVINQCDVLMESATKVECVEATTESLCNSWEILPTQFIPEHTCFGTSTNNGEIITSQNVVCDEQGAGIVNTWDNIDCSGTPTTSEASEDTMHCGGDICSYAAIEEYEGVTECDGDTPAANAFANYTSFGIVPGNIGCIDLDYGSSLKFVCSGSEMRMNLFANSDCTGDAESDEVLISNFCDTSTGNATTVNCNAVATTASPTETTESPSTSPSTPPTTTTEDGDGDDDSPESGACGVKVSSFMILFAVSLYL